MLPEDFMSKTEYGVHNINPLLNTRGMIEDNISCLAYDDTYFYVNYSYSDLLVENMLTEELVIYQGIYEGITISGITQFGCGDITLKNVITVPENEEIVFLPGSMPKFNAAFHLIVNGNITAVGTENDPIVFDKYLADNWFKIEIKESGIAEFEYCEFLNAQYPLSSKGEILVDNCYFHDNDKGIYLEKPVRYVIDNSNITQCGQFGLFF